MFNTIFLLLVPVPYHFSDFNIGIFGFVEIVGTFIANFLSQLIDQS